VGPGSATITATTEGKRDIGITVTTCRCSVTVSPLRELTVGQTMQLAAVTKDAAGNVPPVGR